MPCALRISEAVSIALHAMAFVAGKDDGRASTKAIALRLKASEAHVSKVMQKLVRAKLVSSCSGPGGGFGLGYDAGKITLYDIFRAMGVPSYSDCLFDSSMCRSSKCVFGSILPRINKTVMDYLKGTSLKQVADIYL